GHRRRQASPQALSALCSAVENAVSENVKVCTPTVDVFIREGLFPSAISSSQEKLAAAARGSEGMVAWGNTNTQARDYRVALQQAELTGRPVRFLRWGHELPLLSLEELSRRNVCRFAATGRFIETAAIESALARVDRLYASTSGGDPASLALAAGFQMDSSGQVRSTQSSPPTPHHHHRQHHPSRRRDDPRAGGGSREGGGGERRVRTRRTGEGPEGGETVAGSRGGGVHGLVNSEAFLTSGSLTRAAADRWQGAPSEERLRQQALPPPPPMAQPLPPGPGRLTFDGADGRRYENAAAATAPLGLAQGWTPRGGSG
ncbi:unnamed protein product, partial [Hapterophycus canaliculatus]